MAEPSSEINPLDQLAEEFVERYRNGERPPLSEYIKRHPELETEIRDLFPGLVLMEGVRPQAGEATGAYASISTATPLERLGDYRILREVGRGGMGIVYEAEQESLGRHVALKVLPSHALLDEKYLQRFQREARAAAKLHHTNIVPVYGVGHNDGLHYYVMQFIQGLALDEVLDELKKLRHARRAPITEVAKHRAPVSDVSAVEVAHALLTGDFTTHDLASGGRQPPDYPPNQGADAPRSPDSAVHLPGSSGHSSLSESGRQYWQSVARIGIQVAEALAYAHAQGTLHRDIKPSNLLLDTRGTVWITDFGLAKEADSADLTHTGDLVGTLRYMAPERFAGVSDPRSDLYGLGLTLYELLTLRPAYTVSDRNRLIALVQHEEPPSPRKIDPNVPRDLETIVLKAIAKEPEHRYAAAAALAEDLKRFVEDKPIQARRVSQTERLWRWCRRNPLVASLTAAVALLLVTVTTGAVAFALQQQQAKHDLADALDTAERKKREAEASAASLAVDIDLQHCEHDEIENGILGLARTLQTVPPHATELHQFVEMNLLAWSQQLRQLGPSFQYDGAETLWEFSPDGLTVLTGGADGTARLWDAFTGEVRATLRGHRGPITRVAFSQNSRVAMTVGEDRTARLWDAADGKARAVIEEGSETVLLSPDGRRVLTITHWFPPGASNPADPNAPATVTLWDAGNGALVNHLAGHVGRVNDAAFSPDGRILITGGVGGWANLWSADSGDLIGRLDGIMGEVGAVAFSPEGDVAVSLEDERDQLDQIKVSRVRWWDPHRAIQIGPACVCKATANHPFRCIDRDISVLGLNAKAAVMFVQGSEESIEIPTDAEFCKADQTYILGAKGKLLNRQSGKPITVAAGRRFSEDLARFATDGRFFISLSKRHITYMGALGGGYKTEWSLFDLRTERAIGRPNADPEWRYVPDRKTFLDLTGPTPIYVPIPDTPLDAEVAQLFAEVAACHELDAAGTMHSLDEEAWNKRRGKLAERLRDHPAPFVVHRLAADPWYWLQRKADDFEKPYEEKIKYLDGLIDVEPTWQNYHARARAYWFSSTNRGLQSAEQRKVSEKAARDYLEAGKRAGGGYWHQAHSLKGDVGNQLFGLAGDLSRPAYLTPDEYELGFRLAQAVTGVMPEDQDRRQLLAIASYRTGRYAEALSLLPKREWERHCASQFGRLLISPWTAAIREKEVVVQDLKSPEAVAYLAMTKCRLGQTDEARTVLAFLRTLGFYEIYRPVNGTPGAKRWVNVANSYPDLLREAEALIEGPPHTVTKPPKRPERP